MFLLNKKLNRLIGLSLCIAAIFSACKETPTSVTNDQTVFIEKDGGNWKTIVLPSAESISISAPANSAADLQEIINFQSNATLETGANINYWNGGAIVRWNEVARELVIKNKTNPPVASRIYALLSIAQYDALITTWRAKYKFNNTAAYLKESKIVKNIHDYFPNQSYPSEHATVAGASAKILKQFFPADSVLINDKLISHTESRIYAGVNTRNDINVGLDIGAKTAETVLQTTKDDGSAAVWNGTIPTGEGKWTTAAGKQPLLPMWGQVKTWYVPDVPAIRPTAPPAFTSAEFKAQLAEVRQISDTRTPEQLNIAVKWADGAGTFTPPGHWNQIASDLIRTNAINDLRAARIMAYTNMAIMDAGICCWDAKYAYWLIRPSQADPKITTPVGLPNFPSYTSGHSSFSGAASKMLAFFFPNDAKSLTDMATEASLSRLYGGIHYRMDCEIGISSGNKIADMAILRMKADGVK